MAGIYKNLLLYEPVKIVVKTLPGVIFPKPTPVCVCGGCVGVCVCVWRVCVWGVCMCEGGVCVLRWVYVCDFTAMSFAAV